MQMFSCKPPMPLRCYLHGSPLHVLEDVIPGHVGGSTAPSALIINSLECLNIGTGLER